MMRFKHSMYYPKDRNVAPSLEHDYLPASRRDMICLSTTLSKEFRALITIIPTDIGFRMSGKTPAGHFRLLYFASAASYTRKSSDDFPAPLSIADLFELLEKKYPGIEKAVLSSSAITVNLDYVDVEEEQQAATTSEESKPMVIQEGDEVAIIPPVSSG